METGYPFPHIFGFFPHGMLRQVRKRTGCRPSLIATRHRSASPWVWGEGGGKRQKRLLLTRLKTGFMFKLCDNPVFQQLAGLW